LLVFAVEHERQDIPMKNLMLQASEGVTLKQAQLEYPQVVLPYFPRRNSSLTRGSNEAVPGEDSIDFLVLPFELEGKLQMHGVQSLQGLSSLSILRSSFKTFN
jgi:hypothetical protein